VSIGSVAAILNVNQSAKASIKWSIISTKANLNLTRYRIKLSHNSFNGHEIEWPGKITYFKFWFFFKLIIKFKSPN